MTIVLLPSLPNPLRGQSLDFPGWDVVKPQFGNLCLAGLSIKELESSSKYGLGPATGMNQCLKA